jgi:hypothetical protein
MINDSNIRTLRPLPPPGAHLCALCNSRVDVVLCSFAFERIHRRVPLCREHRQPLIEIDHFTRPGTAPVEDVPPAWVPPVAPRLPRRRSPLGTARAAPTGNLVLLRVR